MSILIDGPDLERHFALMERQTIALEAIAARHGHANGAGTGGEGPATTIRRGPNKPKPEPRKSPTELGLMCGAELEAAMRRSRHHISDMIRDGLFPPHATISAGLGDGWKIKNAKYWDRAVVGAHMQKAALTGDWTYVPPEPPEGDAGSMF